MATEKFIDTFELSLEHSLQEINKDRKIINIEEIKKEILDKFKACISGERERMFYDKLIPLKKDARLSYECELLNLSGSNEGRKILEAIQLAQACFTAINEFGEEENIPKEEKKIYYELNTDISEIIYKNRIDMITFMIDSKSWKTLKKDIYDEKDTTDSLNDTHSFLYNDKQIDFLLGNILLRSSFKVEK